MQYRDDWYEFRPQASSRIRFIPTAYPFTELHLLEQTKVVDITYKNKSIYIVSQSTQRILPAPEVPNTNQLQDLYRDLSPELQRIVGNVEWPSQHELIDIAESMQNGMAMGVSDGSVQTIEDRASQAWILHAANGSEIRGMGPVDGDTDAKTSHRAELQGQAALFIMISLSFCDISN
mmetsp:Transcript_1672/g.2561  ORF Transcript_1672/g.2561 Transcript_1672/m.2561 type:complete len:177 (+) Transcript_1672:263-793(+)